MSYLALLLVLVSSGLFASTAEALYFNNPGNPQESAEPILISAGSSQQDGEATASNRWIVNPYTRNPMRVDLSASPYFYSPLLSSYLKRQDKGLMLDIGALAVKNMVGGGGMGSSPVESKQNNVLQGILRHSG